ncbi:MAG: transposase [Rhodanobacteraceae bacterium]|jgi:putative transposase|nr:transposase [Rhodanobacteraceae bacterium]
MPNYRRVWMLGGTYFFTLALADRGQSLLVDHIGALRAAYAWTRRLHPFRTVAIVVLPDHLHAVWTLPDGSADFALRWKLIKEGFSRRLPRTEPRSPSRRWQGERGIWQRRYWEHAIRDERDLAGHIDYVHFNPVKHGHVQRAAEWRHSSFHRFVREGRLAPDWAG